MKARLFCKISRLLFRQSAGMSVMLDAVQRRLHPRAIGQHRGEPGLVGGIVEIGPDHLGQRHRAVPDRFQELIGDRHRRRFDRRHARAIEDEPTAGSGEQRQDHRMAGEDVFFERSPRRCHKDRTSSCSSCRTFCVAISPGVDGRSADKPLQIRRQIGRPRDIAGEKSGQRHEHGAYQHQSVLHGDPFSPAWTSRKTDPGRAWVWRAP